MKQFRFPACLIVLLAICIHGAVGQTNAPFAQNGSPVATNGAVKTTNARPNRSISRDAGRRLVGATGRVASSRPSRSVSQRTANSRPNYLSSVRSLNPTLAAMNARPSARTYDVQPNVELLPGNDAVLKTLRPTNTRRIPRSEDLQPVRTIPARADFKQNGLPTPDVEPDGRIVQPPSNELEPRETAHSERRHNWHGNKHHRSYSDALRCHRQWRHRDWWKQNFTTIVFVNSGYYFLDGGYWYPAWGYDPVYSYYDYDGPIYTYGNLLPDQVIANVQEALQEAGYYFGPITGSLSVETRAALANFQRDYELQITGAIDQPTVETLGLY